MLQQLLAIIQEGGIQTTESLARRLGVTPRLVAAMLADLEQRGHIVQAGTCHDGCAGCALSEGCTTAPEGRLWVTRTS